MKIKISLAICFTIVALLTITCDSDKCFYSTGKEISTIINTDTFKVIEIRGLFDVELAQDTTYYVEGNGGENVISNIEASVKKDTLTLYNYNSCFWMRKYKKPLVRIHFSDIDRVNVYESSYIFSKDSITNNLYITFQTMMAQCDLTINNNWVFFYVHHFTSGKYVFRGKTKDLSYYDFYSSLVDASELKAETATIENYSITDNKVWVTDRLTAKIFNRGNILYKGNPQIIIDTLASTGRVIKE